MKQPSPRRIRRRKPLKKSSKKMDAIHKPLTELMRKFVMLRDGFKCLRCGKGQTPRVDGNSSIVLQGAHIYGKGAHPAMRYDPRNVICLCKGCHFRWWHKTGYEAAPTNQVRMWCEENLGKKHMETLDLISQATKGKSQKPFDPEATQLFLELQIANFYRSST